MTNPNSSMLVLVASDRPAVQTFFASLRGERTTFAVVGYPFSVEALAERLSQPAEGGVVVLDVAPDPAQAVELCRELRCRQPALPILALFCCADAASPERLRTLLEAGVSGLIDLGTPPAKMMAVLESAVRGTFALRLDLNGNPWHGLDGLFRTDAPSVAADTALTEEDRQLLALLTQGLTDVETGRRLHMSEHTVQHHVQRLWEGLALRNRTELAAWAGRYGLYKSNAGAQRQPGR